TFRFSFQVS
uniref:Predicted gene, 17720 n=1 Tax=Mus spicilegus TaxID=10103 RepID=A0A8C6HIW2_MUSSI